MDPELDPALCECIFLYLFMNGWVDVGESCGTAHQAGTKNPSPNMKNSSQNIMNFDHLGLTLERKCDEDEEEEEKWENTHLARQRFDANVYQRPGMKQSGCSKLTD